MNRRIHNTGSLPLMLILAGIILLASTVSCLKVNEERKFENLIPEKDFKAILYELHLTNGLMSLPGMRNIYTNEDTTGLYMEIIEGYGYTTGQMDTTIQYYYIKKAKRLIKIYDNMLARFSEIQARVDKKYNSASGNVVDQWNGRHSYFMPDTGTAEKPYFNITLATQGTYSLTFSVTVFPDDQTKEPCFTAWLCNADSAETGRKNYLSSIEYLKDGHPHFYTVTGTHTTMERVVIKGYLYDFSNHPDAGLQNAAIENITFYYSGRVE
ncbi:MAG: DUF4296 domain-containing protein [Bacteroidota bacterium]